MPGSYRLIPYRPDDEEFIRAPEAGRRLGVRTREVYRLIEEGVFRIAKDDKGWLRIPRSDIDDYLRRSA
jgi:excisionase family DNA binding protein